MPLQSTVKWLYQISLFDDSYPKTLEKAVRAALDGTSSGGVTAHWQGTTNIQGDPETTVTHLAMEFEVTGTEDVEAEVQAILAGAAGVTALCPASRIRVATGGTYQNLARPYVIHFPVGTAPFRTH